MTTVDIGDLSQQRPAIDLHFGWFGATIRVNPDASDLAFIEFLAVAEGINAASTDAAEMKRATLAMRGWLVDLVHPDDFAEFMELAKKNRQQIQDLTRVAMSIVEAVSSFPTGRPSDSPDGRSRTERRSKAGKRSKRSRRELAAAMGARVAEDVTPVEERALRLLRGRPDLQQQVLAARAARRAGAAG